MQLNIIHLTTQISRKDADQFAPGQWIPECVLDVEWTREPEQPTRLRHMVFLIGAKAPCNFVKLNLTPKLEGKVILASLFC